MSDRDRVTGKLGDGDDYDFDAGLRKIRFFGNLATGILGAGAGAFTHVALLYHDVGVNTGEVAVFGAIAVAFGLMAIASASVFSKF